MKMEVVRTQLILAIYRDTLKKNFIEEMWQIFKEIKKDGINSQ